jgi:zinc transport system substrate-binding protein
MRLILILGSAILIVAGSACSPSAGTGGSGDERVAVAVSVFPLQEAARQVGGRKVDVTSLVPPGAEPHDIELSPDQVDQLLDADLALYVGGGFQPAVEDIAERRDGITVDVLAEVVPEGTTDPHVWLDPVLMAETVEVVSRALSQADPEGSQAYESRAATFREAIERLHQRFANGLEHCERRTFVTTHAAFGHLARRYHLVQRSVAGLSPEAEPDPATLAELEDLIEREGVTTVFTEPLVSPRVAQTLARETGAQVAILDPLEGASEEAGKDATYVSLMERNLGALRDALGCREGA